MRKESMSMAKIILLCLLIMHSLDVFPGNQTFSTLRIFYNIIYYILLIFVYMPYYMVL